MMRKSTRKENKKKGAMDYELLEDLRKGFEDIKAGRVTEWDSRKVYTRAQVKGELKDLRKLFNETKKLKPKFRLTAKQMDEVVEREIHRGNVLEEIETITSKMSRKQALELVRKAGR